MQPEVVVTSADLTAGRVRPESELASHRCPSCDVELADRYYLDCPDCGHAGRPTTRCRGCGGPLELQVVRYVAKGPRGSASKRLCGARCLACNVSAIEEHGLAELDALAGLATGELELLPEAGIFSAEALEVLADAEVCGAAEPEQIVKQHDGMRLRVGSPSPLFEAALGLITEHDPKDIFSPTLSVEPGPPYSAAQRRCVHVLLAEVQRELGAPVSCWSAGVGLSEEPLIDPVLSEQLVRADHDGRALALYHAVVSGQAPGRFLGSVRLLAQVLGVPADDALPGALRARVRALARPPLDILQRLWLAMHPGQAFDEEAVYASMRVFHARYLAAAPCEGGARLPWEEPDYDGYAAWVRRLTSELLAAAEAIEPAIEP